MTTSYGSTQTSGTQTKSHSITLPNLTPSTTYHFKVSSTDASSNTVTSSDYVFTTQAPTFVPTPPQNITPSVMPTGIPDPGYWGNVHPINSVAPSKPAEWPGNDKANYYYIDITSPNATDSIIAGDLIDGPKFPTERDLSPLAGLVAPLGVYYAPGNHEVYGGNTKELFAFTDQYTTGLRDSKITINGTDIVGMNYDAGETPDGVKIRLERSNFDSKNPSIVIIHEPKNNKTIQDMGADLIVSGHTHGGQVWPFTIFVKRIYKEYTSGLNLRNNNASITTTGIGTWGPPIRIGSKPEVIVITFD
jgi:hypothetical protein